jgi:hypothetical protein
MKKTVSCFIVFLLGSLYLCIPAAPCMLDGGQDDSAAKLLGEWTVADKFGKGDGEAEFKADNTYILTEIHPDGIKVTHKGQYKLDISKDPYTIDLCVGECGVPGSEWTTTFGILKFISDNEAAIHFDSSGQRPASFDGIDSRNTHRMTRKTE